MKDKQRIKLVQLNKQTSMKFEDRLAYSFLIRYGLSARRLALYSGLSRKYLPKILARLADQQLVHKQGHKWYGVPSDLVRTFNKDGAEKWYEKVCYTKLFLPSKASPLTSKQNAVYCTIRSVNKTGTSLIATMLKLSRPTVINSIKKLKEHGLLDVLGDAVPVPEEKLHWWQDKNIHKKNKSHTSLTEFFDFFFSDISSNFAVDGVSLPLFRQEMKQFADECPYDGKQHYRLLNKVITSLKYTHKITMVFLNLPKLWKKADAITKDNKNKGAYNGQSSFGLYKLKVLDLCK